MMDFDFISQTMGSYGDDDDDDDNNGDDSSSKAKYTQGDYEDEEVYDGDDKVTLVTKEGLDRLVKELEYLKTTRRKEVAARIKEAISYGDLSENSEYEEAKNDQAFVEGRILELEEKVKSAKIIDEAASSKRCVQLGTTAHLRNLSKIKDEPEVYTIVGSTEADPLSGKISNESP